MKATELEHIEELEEDADTKVLKEWLYREIEEKEYLQKLLFIRIGLVQKEEQEEVDLKSLQPVQRHQVPFRVRRAQKEFEQRKAAAAMRTKPAEKKDLTEGESLFEKELGAS